MKTDHTFEYTDNHQNQWMVCISADGEYHVAADLGEQGLDLGAAPTITLTAVLIGPVGRTPAMVVPMALLSDDFKRELQEFAEGKHYEEFGPHSSGEDVDG